MLGLAIPPVLTPRAVVTVDLLLRWWGEGNQAAEGQAGEEGEGGSQEGGSQEGTCRRRRRLMKERRPTSQTNRTRSSGARPNKQKPAEASASESTDESEEDGLAARAEKRDRSGSGEEEGDEEGDLPAGDALSARTALFSANITPRAQPPCAACRPPMPAKDRRVILRVAPHLNARKTCAACRNRVSGTGLVGPPIGK